MASAMKEYDTLAITSTREIIEKFRNEKLTVESSQFAKINGGFYCLWNRRNVEIKPYMALNKLFCENGYNVTHNPDSLKFLIISESASHQVGTYSNGSPASKLENIISIIDLKKGKLYEVETHMGSSPPNRTRNRSGDIGSNWSDEDYFRNSSYWVEK